MTSEIVSAVIGAIFGVIGSYIINKISYNKKMNDYRRSFISPYKMELLKLPTYLEGATYIVDHHGALTMEQKLEACIPELLKELKEFIINIEEIFTHNNSIYLEKNQLKILFDMYGDAGNLLNELHLEKEDYLIFHAVREEDPLKKLSEKYYKNIENLGGLDIKKNISYESELRMRTYS